jgi:hypothetical protein
MDIKTLSGHLTATNKKHIRAMFDVGVLSAKVNTINYVITQSENVYTVKKTVKDLSIVTGPKFRTHTATFTLS